MPALKGMVKAFKQSLYEVGATVVSDHQSRR